MYATLRYSPGYGDWALTGQADVFAFLNQCQGKIQLSDNFLMNPVKSITAIIGWSSQWQKPEFCKHNSWQYTAHRFLGPADHHRCCGLVLPAKKLLAPPTATIPAAILVHPGNHDDIYVI